MISDNQKRRLNNMTRETQDARLGDVIQKLQKANKELSSKVKGCHKVIEDLKKYVETINPLDGEVGGLDKTKMSEYPSEEKEGDNDA